MEILGSRRVLFRISGKSPSALCAAIVGNYRVLMGAHRGGLNLDITVLFPAEKYRREAIASLIVGVLLAATSYL